MKKIFLFIGLFAFFHQHLDAQQDRFKWRVGAYGGIMSYYGDLSNKWLDPNDQLLNLSDNTDYISYGLSIEKSLSKSWGLRLLYSKGQFIANDRQVDWDGESLSDYSNFNRSLNVKTELTDWSVLASYYFDNEKIFGKTAFIAPYLSLGLGWTDFKTYGDLFYADGSRYHYWSDGTIRNAPESTGAGTVIEQDGEFETALRNLQTEGEDYNSSLFHMTAGLGLKFRITERFNINLESLIHLTNTDYLDDVSGKHLSDFDNNIQQYAAIPGEQLGEFRGNENGDKDIFALTTISVHYNFGRKRNAFVAPAIRVGALNQAFPQETPMPIAKVAVDTQAIYVATVTIDSAYLVPAVSEETTEVGIDTIYKVGNRIYSVGNKKEWTESEDGWDLIQQYFYNEELLLDSLYDTSEAALDTQVIYMINVPIDSTFVLDDLDADLPEEIAIDTFFQVGHQIYTDDFSDFVQKEDWVVIRDQYLDFPETEKADLSYEEYMEIEATMDLSPPVIPDPIVINSSVDSTTQVIVPQLDSESNLDVDGDLDNELDPEFAEFPETIIPVSNDSNIDSVYHKINELSDEIKSVKDQKETTQDIETINKLNQIQLQLDSIRSFQMGLPNGMNEEWKQTFEQATQQLEEQIIDAKKEDTTTIIVQQDNKELLLLQAEIARMQKQIDSKDDPELERIKKQLWLYELQLKDDRQDQKRYDEINDELRALNKAYQLGQNNNTPQQKTGVITTNDVALAQLKTEVSSMNESLELMRQLMLRQQITNGLTKPQQPAVVDNSSAELSAMRVEIAALQLALAKNANQPVVTKPTPDNQEELTALRNQVAALESQITTLPNPVVTPPIVIEKTIPVEPKKETIDIRKIIRGKDKQLVFFPIGSAILSSESVQTIRGVAQLLTNYDQLSVFLEGYTDPSGNPEKNLLLSKKRTEAVKSELQKYGVTPDRIVLDYRGEDLQSNAAYGRRVELKLQVQ